MNKHFLLKFNRRTGVLDMDSFTGLGSGRRALNARFAAEDANSDADVEIVVVEAKSEEALRATHSRYFRSLSELADDLSDTFGRPTMMKRAV